MRNILLFLLLVYFPYLNAQNYSTISTDKISYFGYDSYFDILAIRIDSTEISGDTINYYN